MALTFELWAVMHVRRCRNELFDDLFYFNKIVFIYFFNSLCNLIVHCQLNNQLDVLTHQATHSSKKKALEISQFFPILFSSIDIHIVNVEESRQFTRFFNNCMQFAPLFIGCENASYIMAQSAPAREQQKCWNEPSIFFIFSSTCELF